MEWEKINDIRYRAQHGSLTLMVWHEREYVTGAMIWCWNVHSKNWDGVNGGCNHDLQAAQRECFFAAWEAEPLPMPLSIYG